MKLQGVQLYILVIVALLHQTIGLDFESTSESLDKGFESISEPWMDFDLEKLYDQAESDLAEKQTRDFASGSTSKRFHRKRENALTKEMTKNASAQQPLNTVCVTVRS